MTKPKLAGRQKPRTFFDRKVRQEGYTRSLSLGKIIPKDWRYVRVHVHKREERFIVLHIEKLLGEEINAQTKKTNPRRKQNT